MDRLNEIIAALSDPALVAEASDDTLKELLSELREFATNVRAGETEVDDPVGTLTAVADYFEGVTYALAVRAEEAAERQAQIDTQAARLGLDKPAAAPEPPESAAEARKPDDPAPAAAPEAVVAAAPAEAPPEPPAAPAAPAPLPALSAIETPPEAQPVVAVDRPRFMKLETGEHVDFDDVVTATIEKIERCQAMSSPGSELVPVARVKLDFPEDRKLNNAGLATQAYNGKLDELMRDAWRPEKWTPEALTAAGVPESLVASGGFCAPAMPDYDLPQIAGTQRPVAGYLPTVQADRGQIIVLQPPKLADITRSTAQVAGSAVSIWTNTVDTTPGGTTKPVMSLACPSPLTVTTEAIVEQLQIGNFEARAFPELVRVVMANTASQWARLAESELLRQINSNSTAVTATQILGAVADLKGQIHQAAAAIRNRHRMDPNARLRVILPAWVQDLLAQDLGHMHAGDGLEKFTLDPETFLRQIGVSANVNITLHQDSANLVQGNAANQLFAPVQQASTDLANFPPQGTTSARVIWYIFPEGTFARADAGTLELGIVRDSTLNNTNDYRFFTESWEAVVPKVIESYAVTSTICPTGAGASDVSSSGFCTAS